ncbi:MAG: HPr family phosphocarrier protein [Anaerolineae bacterium]|nr:HPr family phosphocarrier protein [Anaerolineae bacterium]
MPEISLTIQHDAGLHARPLAQFVKTVKLYNADVQVYNISTGKGPANGASPVKLMLLSVTKGQTIRIVSEGPDSQQVLDALERLIQNNFSSEE